MIKGEDDAIEIKALAEQMSRDNLKAGLQANHFTAAAAERAAKEKAYLFEEYARSALKYFYKHYTIT